MPEDPNKLYSTYKTTAWFAVASVILLASLVLMVFSDHGREWKRWQRKFVELERKKIEAELKTAEAAVDPKKLEDAKAKLKEALSKLNQQKSEMARWQSEKEALALSLTKAKTRYQDLKQYSDSYRFFFEEHQARGAKQETQEYREKLAKLTPELDQAKLEQEALEKKQEDIDRAVLALESDTKKLTKEINQMLRDTQILEKKLKTLEPSVVKEVLNAPMLDFVAPTLQIQQVVLEDLHDDFYFAKTQKVDRCTTCHLAIDRKGFEDAPQPFKTHPNLDLFLGSSSPHPLEKIGCTVCHGGSGHSLTFTTTAHTPQNEEQAKEWKKKYHWHELEKWEAKMLPLQHTEASCVSCHQGAVNVPQAPKLNEGRNLARTYGCFACHTVKGFEDQWKVGPSLLNIKGKVSQEWIVKWLHGPKHFRPSTRMPTIFHLDNTNLPEDRAKSSVAIEGIASYLVKNSEEISLKKAPTGGDPEVGKKLVGEIGCLGCHSAQGVSVNDHGPELTHLGSKVSRDWLFAWLKNPRSVSEHTRMPNLRLSDGEALDIASYLLQDRNANFDSMKPPAVSDGDLNHFALDYMAQKMRHAEAEEKLSKMDRDAKLQFVGREMILQQGCFGCHDIKGFETMKPIGTELTKEGQKEVNKLDFGFIKIEYSRQAWFFQKLKHPRSFDEGKEKAYHEKLRMPEFGFTDEQANALTTFLLSLREEGIPLEMQRNLNLKEQSIEAGRFLVAQYNCQGCHTLDGTDGRARVLFEDKGNAPPAIDGEGAKTQEHWLYHFLQNPTTIRPWLKYRMPTFGFSEEETNAVIHYFANLDKQQTSYAPSQPLEAKREEIAAGHELFIKFKCIQCHQSATEGLTASFLAPDLLLSKNRLKPNWVVEWLKDPQQIQAGTMMPTFFPDGQSPVQDILGGEMEKQVRAIRDYLWQFTPEDADQIKQLNAK